MLRVGQEIGPYTLIRQLGKGGFKIVWLAEKRTSLLTTQVAVGVIYDPNPDLTVIREEAERWKHASGHVNVLPVLDADIYDDQVVIVSEYAPDGDLQTLMNQAGDELLPYPETIRIVCGILAGLEHLHGLNPPIIHRDLKPENILMQGTTPKVTDFGMSRVFNATIYSRISGTPSYMPPEAFDGKSTRQSDLWSVGVILYQMLSGKLPYPQKDMLALYGALMQGNPEPLPESVPAPLREAVNKSLQKDVSLRYQTASEMRVDLEHSLSPDGATHSNNTVSSKQDIARPISTTTPLLSGSHKPEDMTNRFGNMKGFLTGVSVCLALASATGAFIYFANKPHAKTLQPDSHNQAGSRSSTSKINAIDGAEMQLIPAGTFEMGDTGQSYNPKHQVTLSKSYWMYANLVTVAQFRKFDKATGIKYDWKGNVPKWGWIDVHPMVKVNWNEAEEYCKWAGCRLPTEAEWEHAARGTTDSKFPWGNKFDGAKCANSVPPNKLKSAVAIGTYPSNSFGLKDMAGNAWQWCSDWYDQGYTQRNATDPEGAASGTSCVLRGGCWSDHNPENFRSSCRVDGDPTEGDDGLGFRCASGE